MNFNNFLKEDDRPYISLIEDNYPKFELQERIDAMDSGTLIQMNDINLKNIGNEAFECLGYKLANQFLLSSLENQKILLFVKQNKSDAINFKKVEKSVAIKNMAYVCFAPEKKIPLEIQTLKNNYVELPAKNKENSYRFKTELFN
jgi:hypothetical protein